jgi:hypothetical protein
MIGRAMKSQPAWKSPSAAPYLPVKESITEKKLIVMWRSMKTIRKRPLILMMSFLVIEESAIIVIILLVNYRV